MEQGNSPSADIEKEKEPVETPPARPSSDRKKGRRGPTAGRFQNGKACFSAWYDAKFLVRMRRYAARLGFTDVASMIRSHYLERISGIPLTEEDLAEIEEAERSIRHGMDGK